MRRRRIAALRKATVRLVFSAFLFAETKRRFNFVPDKTRQAYCILHSPPGRVILNQGGNRKLVFLVARIKELFSFGFLGFSPNCANGAGFFIAEK